MCRNQVTLIRRWGNQEPWYAQMGYRGRGQAEDRSTRCLFTPWTLPRPGIRLTLLEIFDGMEYWIPDSPLTLLAAKRSKSKKEQPSSSTPIQPTANGLILSSGDAIFAATLKKGEAPGPILEWDFVQKPSSIVPLQDCAWVLTSFNHQGNTRIKAINTAYKLFPSTRPATHAPPALNLRQKTGQAVRPLSNAKLI